MSKVDLELTPQRRALLAHKGKLLYGKYCGTRGRGICAESFAIYQLQQGNRSVVVDFLGYVQEQLSKLQSSDPAGQLLMTRELIRRLEQHLEDGLEEID